MSAHAFWPTNATGWYALAMGLFALASACYSFVVRRASFTKFIEKRRTDEKRGSLSWMLYLDEHPIATNEKEPAETRDDRVIAAHDPLLDAFEQLERDVAHRERKARLIEHARRLDEQGLRREIDVLPETPLKIRMERFGRDPYFIPPADTGHMRYSFRIVHGDDT